MTFLERAAKLTRDLRELHVIAKDDYATYCQRDKYVILKIDVSQNSDRETVKLAIKDEFRFKELEFNENYQGITCKIYTPLEEI